MSRLSLEQLITTPALNFRNANAYDYTKWNVGKGLVFNNGATPVDKYVSPDFQVLRPMEESTPFATNQIFAYSLSDTVNYIFGVESAVGATNTRRVHLWEMNRQTGTRAWKGFITLTLATATAHTVRDFKIDVKNESEGTVAVSGTAVTGVLTKFATNKVAIGARIGFGSTDPAQITTWYRVTARASDLGLTINASAGTVTAGTPYVIQEFRPIYVATNATTTNGGIHYAKGVSIEDYITSGTTIPLAVSTDEQKAVYWLKDASTQTNLVSAGMACDFDNATPTNLNAYVLDLVVAGQYKVFKYNLRANLTVASGNSVNAFVLVTGQQVVTGTGSQNANCVYANTMHGVGNGIPSIYFVTTTRMYRADITLITSLSTTWISDNIAEIPIGGTSTFAVTNALNTIEYVSGIDAFIVGTSHTGGVGSYITQYVASGSQFQKMFGRDFKYLEQTLKDSNHPTIFSNQSTACSYTSAGGNRVFICKQGTTVSTNQIYVTAFGADWDYALQSTGRLISPEIVTPNVLKYYRIFANDVKYQGNNALGKSSEGFKIYVRTANIQADETTGWTLVDQLNDLSGLAGASSIQFAIEFRTIGEHCMPNRILGLNLSYEDNTTDAHYAVSVAKSSLASKIFGWWFKTAWGGTVPTLTVRLYDADTGGLLLSDTTATSASGTFEKTTDGTTWTAYNSTDRANATTWIRYTPTSLADNIKVQAYITNG